MEEEGLAVKGGKRLVEREGRKRGGRTGVGALATEGLYLPPTCPHVSPGRCLPGVYTWRVLADRKNSYLVEAEPMQLVCLMPTIHFRATGEPQEECQG